MVVDLLPSDNPSDREQNNAAMWFGSKDPGRTIEIGVRLAGGAVKTAPGVTSEALRRYSVGILMIVYMFNQIDRQIIAVLGQSIKVDLQLSDTQLGFLTGFAFAVFYSFTSVPIALMADRSNRRNLIALSLTLWSGMTAVCGLAQNFIQLAAARVAVGIGEAGCSPPAHSMISDLFSRERRATALAVYGLGIPLGTLGGLMIGGVLGGSLGWRSALLVIGFPGLILALILRLTVPEPRRGHADAVDEADERAPSLKATIRYLWARPTFKHMLIGGSINTAIATNMIVWTPAFLVRSFGMSLGHIGIWLGLAAGIPGAIGMYLGGFLADRVGKIDTRWRLWVASVALSLLCPFCVAAYLAPSPFISLGLMTIPFMLNTVYAASTFAQTQGIVGIKMRATAASILLCVLAFVGYGGGPQVVGILSDILAPYAKVQSLRYSLALFSLTSLWAAWHFFKAGQHLEVDLTAVGKRMPRDFQAAAVRAAA
jgi:MFS family permease